MFRKIREHFVRVANSSIHNNNSVAFAEEVKIKKKKNNSTVFNCTSIFSCVAALQLSSTFTRFLVAITRFRPKFICSTFLLFKVAVLLILSFMD